MEGPWTWHVTTVPPSDGLITAVSCTVTGSPSDGGTVVTLSDVQISLPNYYLFHTPLHIGTNSSLAKPWLNGFK